MSLEDKTLLFDGVVNQSLTLTLVDDICSMFLQNNFKVVENDIQFIKYFDRWRNNDNFMSNPEIIYTNCTKYLVFTK
jgi:hypothetical protein